MFLGLKDVANLFQESKGVQDDIYFLTVSDRADEEQPKGLFIPLHGNAGELLDAIANGAVAAIWEKEKGLPSYTPSQFPIFFVKDLTAAVSELILLYKEKLDGETNNQMEITNFKLSNLKLLNEDEQTYDIAGLAAELSKKFAENQQRRG